jgi:DNA-binding CsgD family transcriptional regulator
VTQPDPVADRGIEEGVLDEVGRLLARGEAAAAVRIARGLLADGLSPREAAPVHLAVARALVELGRDEEAIEELVAIEGALPDVEAARLAALLAALRIVTGRARGDVTEAATALDAGLRMRDPRTVAEAWRSLAFAYYYRGELQESVRVAREHLEWCRQQMSAATMAEAMLGLGISLMHADGFDEAAGMLDGAQEAAESEGVAIQAAVHRALLDLHAGRWEAASTIDAILAASPAPDWLAGLASGLIAVVRAHRDQLEDATRALEIAPAVVAQAPRPMQLWATMLIASARGKHERAASAAERLVRVTFALNSPIRFRLYGPDTVRELIRAGDLVTAREVASALDLAEGRAGVASVSAAARLCRGLIDHDVALIGEAANLFEAGPRRFDAAMARMWLAEAMVDAGRVDEAITAYDGALTALTAIGAHREVRLVERALRQLGRRPGRRGPRARATSGWASLTPTELQVAELVRQGMSNAEIARQMVVSARTVEAHLGHVFAKLGVASRTQLAIAVGGRDR